MVNVDESVRKELRRLLDEVPPRKPRGSPENITRLRKFAKFAGYANSHGLTPTEAITLCRDKRENAGT